MPWRMATEQTRETGEFTVPGLGKFVKAERKERMGRNPATGEQMNIAAKTTVKYHIAKAAMDAEALRRCVVVFGWNPCVPVNIVAESFRLGRHTAILSATQNCRSLWMSASLPSRIIQDRQARRIKA